MPAPVKEIQAGVYCKWLFRQQRARGVLPFSLLHQKRREISGWLTQGNRVNERFYRKTKSDYGELAIYR
ncbi:hypothetical protein ACLK17_11455 [Escherichia coli]